MRKELEIYVILMAVVLPLQYLSSFYLPDSTLADLFQNTDPSANFGDELDKYNSLNLLKLIISFLPGIVTAVWVLKIKSIKLTHKWAWIILGLLLDYFILIFYISGQLLNNNEEKA